MDAAAAAGSALQMRVLAMTLTDARATIAQVMEQTSPTPTADVVLNLSVAAQQLLKTPPVD